MSDRIRIAQMRDYPAVCRFYRETCEALPGAEYGPAWIWGVYPSEDMLREHMESGELFVKTRDGELVAALILLDHEDPEYVSVPWEIRSPSPVCAIHLFAVHPAFRGKMLGEECLRELFAVCRQKRMAAVHLDVVKGNLPAEKLYQKMGFQFICDREIYYPDAGDLLVSLYEYLL